MVDWRSLHESSSIESFPILFTNILLEICREYVPKKQNKRGKRRPHNNLKALRRKKKRLTSRLAKAKNRLALNAVNALQAKICEVNSQIKNTHISNRVRDEKNAIDKIKKDPKFFYAYAKSHKKERSNVSMLTNNSGDLVAEREPVANILQDQFCKALPKPRKRV